MTTKGGKTGQFLRRNWFKLFVVGLFLFLMFKKDFSFKIDLRSPLRKEVQEGRDLMPVQQPPDRSSQERYTEALPSQEEVGQQSSAFNLNPISGSRKSHKRIFQEFEQIDPTTIAAFIQRFGHVAVSERKKYGVPASLILANGLLISKAGTSEMSRSGHNYFGLGCTEDWIGEQGFYGGTCFRHYENAWTSFRDHSLFLTTGKLSKLSSLGRDDYKAWARALDKEGFYEHKNTDEAILQIIKRYQLDRFDQD
jgi:flagellum-specific peptidoglycan hydrolase FlgJ